MAKLALAFPGGYSVEGPSGFKFAGGNLGNIINALVPYIFGMAGLALLVILIWGGFELMTSAGDPKKMQSAQGKLTNAVVGFIIIFVAYWLVQILEVIFGIKIF
jgi:hypothetical protein